MSPRSRSLALGQVTPSAPGTFGGVPIAYWIGAAAFTVYLFSQLSARSKSTVNVAGYRDPISGKWTTGPGQVTQKEAEKIYQYTRS